MIVIDRNKFRFKFKNNQAAANPIFFIHGLVGNSSNMTQFAEKITEHDYYSVDLPNHDEQIEWKKIKLTIDYFAEQIAQFIVERNLTNITLMGHSMGGAISLTLITKISHRIRNIILISPATPALAFKTERVGITYRTLRKWLINFKHWIKEIFHQLIHGSKPNPAFNIKVEHKKLKQQFRNLIAHYHHFAEINGGFWQEKRKFRQLVSPWVYLLIRDLFSKKNSIKLKIALMSQPQLRKMPVLYISGKHYDFLTPQNDVKEFLNQNFLHINHIILDSGAHIPFWSDFDNFFTAVHQFMADPKQDFQLTKYQFLH
ncbi:pimeloyl-ACP methyl ester carboxylesterase [Mycoplasmoides fastidiosum]|uniref:Pimeloyl-ACP methyl ester carboxylesterase n=1 Tax=Mycoplasmoides fastidiosum TaxID=92758 RepID=A0ABU0LZU5_9BACT|nr:alpha/beta hydrolase [Mycoplasmoides fastidiosum]MDQ0514203.1 pimeloyl-ACP methyl ester carboxylesterase [Mycoplasmoides fastidiosum]UUD37387.1 alpha/beta hydrolase [Mycoplasmoides fastidiosum]